METFEFNFMVFFLLLLSIGSAFIQHTASSKVRARSSAKKILSEQNKG